MQTFPGRRPITPDDKKCVVCAGRLEADTDGAGNSIDKCVKCGKPYQPRGVARIPSPTAATTSSPAARKAKAPRGGHRKQQRRVASTRPRKLATDGRGRHGVDAAIVSLKQELEETESRCNVLLEAIASLESIRTNGNGKNGRHS